MSTDRDLIPFTALYSDAEAQLISNGLVPESMDDKWFVYSENGWVCIHRSWTGHCVFMLKLDASPSGVRVTEAWVTRDSSHYNSPGVDAELEMVSGIVKKCCL